MAFHLFIMLYFAAWTGSLRIVFKR